MNTVPYGHCHCGCGQKTNVSRKTDRHAGHTKGEPIKYILGHRHRPRQEHRVEERGHDTPCWISNRAKNHDGYAIMNIPTGRVCVHRLRYEQQYGSLPDSQDVHHLCLQRACERPSHLFAIEHGEHTHIHRAIDGELEWQIVALLPQLNLSQCEIAKRCGTTQATVSKVWLRHFPHTNRRFESKNQRRELIRQLYNEGWLHREIAAHLGISRPAVTRAVNVQRD